MSQSDYTIADQDGASFLVDINAQLAAIVSNNSGATEPTTTYAYQWWADTSAGVLKQRNAANNAWITIGTLASTNLGLLALTGGTLTGALNEAQGSDIASAGTVNLTTATGNYVHITGTTTITAITLAQGAERTVVFDGALTLTNGASLLLPTSANITTAAGDTAVFRGEAAGVVRCVAYVRKDGTSLASTATDKIQQITASVGSNALTVTLNPTVLDFRSSTLGSGTVNTRTVSVAISVVVSSGSTLGTVSTVPNRLAVLAIDNAGTVELAVVNIAGGTNLDETGVISTTAEGGAGAANSATVIYSTTARTNVPYRVVGFVESAQATAGTWATTPSKVQGYGGQAFAAMSSLGYGQTWQDVSASRTQGTTYYNTTGKPIAAIFSCQTNGTVNIIINGATQTQMSASTGIVSAFLFIVPTNQSYSIANASGTTTTAAWKELR
jgi:hypothetical protein